MALFCRRHAFDTVLALSLIALLGLIARRRADDKETSDSDSLNEEILFDETVPDSSTKSKENLERSALKALNDPSVDQRIKAIEDVRKPYCREKKYRHTDKVTIIVDYNDYQFFNVKNTLESVAYFSNWDLIEEVLVVDDASSLDYIKDDAKKFLTSMPKTRLLRTDRVEPVGSPRARALAAKKAKSDILVFIDRNTLVTNGWLDPLIHLLSEDEKIVAVPHYDLIRDPVSLNYITTPEKTVATFSWNLSIRMRQAKELPHSEGGQYKSPIVRGNVFAVKRSFFDAIGGYDEKLEDVGGEHLELSLRTWLCGGKIIVTECSRVGILNLNDPVKVTLKRNIVQLTEMWFGTRKSIVYRSVSMTFGNTIKTTSGSVEQAIKTRKQSIPVIDDCKAIDWYLENVAHSIITPSMEAVRFGILRVKTGRCSKLLSTKRIKLDDCTSDHYNTHPREMIFELTKSGNVKVMDRCLTVKTNAYILAEECVEGETKQLWKLASDELINDWSNYCAMHVTDPDKSTEGDRQIMMAQACQTDSKEGSLFKKWEFVAL